MSYDAMRPFSCPVMMVSSRNHSMDVIFECFIGSDIVDCWLLSDESN